MLYKNHIALKIVVFILTEIIMCGPCFPVLRRVIYEGICKRHSGDDDYGNFGSLAGRLRCLKGAAICLAYTIVAPFVAIARMYKGYNKIPRHLSFQEWTKSRSIAVLDAIACVLASPVIALAVTIKYLAGAIIHPGIVYLNEDAYEDVVEDF
jgi:hypothetical protein